MCTLWFPSSVPAYLLFLVLPLEAPTHRVAGAPLSHSGPTAGPSPRLFPRPLNISISQVGAGAHPVTAHPLFLPLSQCFEFTSFSISKFLSLICLPLSLKTLHRSAFALISSIVPNKAIFFLTGKRANFSCPALKKNI